MSSANSVSQAESFPGVPRGENFPAALVDRLGRARVMAVITVERVEDAAPLAVVLQQAGVHAVELAWRTPATLAVARAMKEATPSLILGLGTLLSAEQVRLAAEAGADFGVSPGLSVAVIEAARETKLAYAPGIQTASDLQTAVAMGCNVVKFFPAESAGGLAHLKSLHAPFAHLGLRYIPLGGLTEDNVDGYLKEESVVAVGGSWIAPPTLIRARAWEEVRQRAQAMVLRAEKFSSLRHS